MSVPNQTKSEVSRKRKMQTCNDSNNQHEKNIAEDSSKPTGSAPPENNVENDGFSRANQRQEYETFVNAETDRANYQHDLETQQKVAALQAKNYDSDNEPSQRRKRPNDFTPTISTVRKRKMLTCNDPNNQHENDISTVSAISNVSFGPDHRTDKQVTSNDSVVNVDPPDNDNGSSRPKKRKESDMPGGNVIQKCHDEISNVATPSVVEGAPSTSSSSTSNSTTFDGGKHDESCTCRLNSTEEDKLSSPLHSRTQSSGTITPVTTDNDLSDYHVSDAESDGNDISTDSSNDDFYHPRRSRHLLSDDEGYLQMIQNVRDCHITTGIIGIPDSWPSYSPKPLVTGLGEPSWRSQRDGLQIEPGQTDTVIVSPVQMSRESPSEMNRNPSWGSDDVFLPPVSKTGNQEKVYDLENPAVETQSRLGELRPNAFPGGPVEEEVSSNVATEKPSDRAIEGGIGSASSEKGHLPNEPQVPEEEPNTTANEESDVIGSSL